MRAAVFATLIVLCFTANAIAATPARTQSVCPVPASKALDEAQKILQADDRAKLDIALACVTLALAQTRAELAGLRDGSLAFSG